MDTCKHHEAIEQCAKTAKKKADSAVSNVLFIWVIGGLTALFLILLGVVNANTAENSKLFHRIDKNIAIIANHVGCEDKIDRSSR